MRPIGLDDIIGRERYGEARETIRRRVIAHKRPRRVAVGDRLSLVFEDRATVWYQTQEMLWVEQVTKRGWTSWQIPDVLHPEASAAWAAMLAVAALIYVASFRTQSGR